MRRFNLQGLETLCCIARLGTFHAAALYLNTTQPAVSARIRDLENAVGIPLFRKQGRRMALTLQGRELVQMTEPLLQSLEDVMVALGNPEAATGVVRIGTGEIVALSWLPELIGRLKTLMPRVTYEIDVDLTVTMRQRLESGKIDIAIVAAPIVLNEIAAISLGTVSMVWVISPALKKMPNQGKKPSVGQLFESFPIWSLSRPSAIYPISVAALKEFNVKAQSIHTYDNMQGIIKLVLNGSGIALLPRVLVENHLSEGRLVKLSSKLPEPELEFAIAWNAGREHAVIQNIVKMAVECSTFKKK